jgi:outer membrane protein assembly factor BamB
MRPQVVGIRLSYIALCLVLSIGVLHGQQAAPAAGPAAAPADEWRQFRGTPRLTGNSSTTLPTTLKVLWTYDVGDLIDSSAAIANGVVYIGGGNGDLIALDLATGKLRWKYSTGNLIGESSPAVGSNAVYIGDLGGLVHAVNIADGKPLWTYRTQSEIKSSPVVADGAVLIGSYDGSLYALDPGTGKLKWKAQTNGMVHATPAVQNGLAFIAGCDSMLRAIRIADGKEAYQINSGAYTGASPLIDGTRAYFGTFNNDVLAFDLQRRRLLWRYSDPDRRFPFYSSAALANGRIILGGARQVDPCDRREDGESGVDVRDTRQGGFLAGDCRRAASMSARATGGSTCSTPRAARSCSNSTPARL